MIKALAQVSKEAQGLWTKQSLGEVGPPRAGSLAHLPCCPTGRGDVGVFRRGRQGHFILCGVTPGLPSHPRGSRNFRESVEGESGPSDVFGRVEVWSHSISVTPSRRRDVHSPVGTGLWVPPVGRALL